MTQAPFNCSEHHTTAHALNFQQIYVFGDSYSDIGNAYHETNHLLAGAPNLPGRFSNGSVWVERFAADSQLILEPSCQTIASQTAHPAVNFAYGGATTGESNLFPAIMPELPALSGLQQQIAQFTQGAQQGRYPITSATLGIIWAGAADYAPFVNGIPQHTETTIPLQNLKAAITQLIELGISQILVLNVPDLSRTPLAPMVAEITPPEQIHATIAAHNAELATWANGQQVQLFDLNAWLNQVLAQPETYGFENIQQGASLVEGTNAETALFWDQVHFSARGHAVLAHAVAQTIQAPVLR